VGTKEGNDCSPDSSAVVVTPTAEPVVSTPVVKSTDENEPKDHEIDTEKTDTQVKDSEFPGAQSDTEGSVRGGRGGNRAGKPRNTGRGPQTKANGKK